MNMNGTVTFSDELLRCVTFDSLHLRRCFSRESISNISTIQPVGFHSSAGGAFLGCRVLAGDLLVVSECNKRFAALSGHFSLEKSSHFHSFLFHVSHVSILWIVEWIAPIQLHPLLYGNSRSQSWIISI